MKIKENATNKIKYLEITALYLAVKRRQNPTRRGLNPRFGWNVGTDPHPHQRSIATSTEMKERRYPATNGITCTKLKLTAKSC
jgi:hypothetical protein